MIYNLRKSEYRFDLVSTRTRGGTRYNIMYVIMFASDLRRGRWFSQGIPVSSTNKIDLHDIIEILLKVALTTISHKPEVEHTNYVNRSCRIYRTIFVFISKHVLHITNANYILVNYIMCCHSIFFMNILLYIY